MLVLSRKRNEAIRIGDGIEVVVSQIRGNSVRLAISAPPSVPIFRKELVERMGKEADSPTESEALPCQPCC
jgi:carbon storage regulator